MAPRLPAILANASMAERRVSTGVTGEQLDVFACLLAWLLCGTVIIFYFAAVEANSPSSAITDFSAFYTSGKLASENPRQLYDHRQLLEGLERQFSVSDKHLPDYAYQHFSYPPIVPLVFSAISRVKYSVAYRSAQIVLVILYVLGIWLCVRESNNATVRIAAFPMALAYLPFLFSITSGQLSAVACFLCAASLSSKHRFLSGFLIGLLAYKPPLAIVVVPVVLAIRQWRTMFGVATGIAVLYVPPVLAWGPGIYAAWLHALREASTLPRPVMIYADVYAFGVNMGLSRWVVFALVAGMLLVLFTKAKSSAVAMGFTLLVSPYVPLYDTLLIFPACLLRSRRFWLCPLFVIASWITVPVTAAYHVQIVTVAIGSAIGLQIWDSRALRPTLKIAEASTVS